MLKSCGRSSTNADAGWLRQHSQARDTTQGRERRHRSPRKWLQPCTQASGVLAAAAVFVIIVARPGYRAVVFFHRRRCLGGTRLCCSDPPWMTV
ncbi:hypothetical protein Dimus_033611, partial [Dionaea muscipula]